LRIQSLPEIKTIEGFTDLLELMNGRRELGPDVGPNKTISDLGFCPMALIRSWPELIRRTMTVLPMILNPYSSLVVYLLDPDGGLATLAR
jgi:hypothetical protein